MANLVTIHVWVLHKGIIETEEKAFICVCFLQNCEVRVNITHRDRTKYMTAHIIDMTQENF